MRIGRCSCWSNGMCCCAGKRVGTFIAERPPDRPRPLTSAVCIFWGGRAVSENRRAVGCRHGAGAPRGSARGQAAVRSRAAGRGRGSISNVRSPRRCATHTAKDSSCSVRRSSCSEPLPRPGLPAVVMGHLYPSVRGLPFVDRDQARVGRLLAEHLLAQGHRRIAFLSRQRFAAGRPCGVGCGARRPWGPRRGLSAAALTFRGLPDDREVVRDEVEHLLRQSDDLPGLLTRPTMMADVASEVIESLGLAPGRDVAVCGGRLLRALGRHASLPGNPPPAHLAAAGRTCRSAPESAGPGPTT